MEKWTYRRSEAQATSWRYPWPAVGPRHEKFDPKVSPCNWSRLPAAEWVCNRYKGADHDTRRNAANSMSGKKGFESEDIVYHVSFAENTVIHRSCQMYLQVSLLTEILFRSFGTHFQTNGTTWLLDCMLNLFLGNPEHRCMSAQPIISSSVLKPASWDSSALR